ncbi:MAG: helix-turn-helix domain-containing protein [Alphaproteobacteria bacterium]|uniref:helix-turn-helix domain-containing protein n=1 Tax=Brevundimonas sp. TaxID=1871086 RepID=UPI0017B9A309|nr:helix-turn-helix domain-containing protein [Brevundimonas sp.]MBU3970531.1 helix-turn-helix domain-containing protein [Alphaproteobacteria bacterium]MBA3049792.1 cyclic nucleotide-binding domain-containing protein [Brevundimonas sp.]MBU3973033.1 helix-turn-helix domain-containing protein [Alphaproteobacteria bacterium]MBU4039975.1 helix-turn-helix domain-containing protein [Alphaproteobacteria bacterium]MBU4135205.1 helix-turn-helix domain-containing protein [Alphaproteobacteria bacterium]
MFQPLAANFAEATPVTDEWAGAARLTFKSGEEIYAQDEDADLIYRLVRGAARTSHLLADGRRQIGDFYYEGDVLGVEVGEAHRYSAEALSDCEVLAIRRSGSAAYDAARYERMIWKATANELHRAQSHMLLLGRATACEKVAHFLIDIAERFRGDLIALPMSRQDMADYLGLTIETVSRMLGRLQADGMVEFFGARNYRIRRFGALSDLAAA